MEKEESLMEVDWDQIENEYTGVPTDYPEGHFKYLSQVPDGISENKIVHVHDSSEPVLPQEGLRIQRPDAIGHHKVNEVDRDHLQKPNIL